MCLVVSRAYTFSVVFLMARKSTCCFAAAVLDPKIWGMFYGLPCALTDHISNMRIRNYSQNQGAQPDRRSAGGWIYGLGLTAFYLEHKRDYYCFLINALGIQ
jgi:hypothetical protein